MTQASPTPNPSTKIDRYSLPTLFTSIGEKFPERLDDESGDGATVVESLDILSNFARPLPKQEEPEEDENHVDLSQSTFRQNVPQIDKASMHARARLDAKHENDPSLHEYMNDSTSINRSLHTFHRKENISKLSKNLWKADDVGYDVENLDHLLDNHKTNGAMTVYSGIHHDPGIHFKPDANGKIPETVLYHHPAYMSTTTEPKVAQEFAHFIPLKPEGFNTTKHKPRTDQDLNVDHVEKSGDVRHIIQLHMPDQTKASSVWMRAKQNDPWAPNNREEEILLHRGHNIEIHRNPTIHPDGKTVVWHAKIHSHDPAPREDFDKYINE